MKRAQVIVVFFAALSLLTSISASAGPVIDRILKRGELVVGTSGDQPPLTVKTKEGNIIGLDVDLAKIMADAMGVKLRLETMPFPELLPALQAGKIDMILSGMTITAQRNLRVAYVGPYYISGKGILARSQTIASYQDAAPINNPAFTLVALKNSTGQVFVETLIPEAKLILTNTLEEALNFLLKDKADALIADYPFCAVAAFRYKEKGLIAGPARFNFEPLGIALPEGDPLLVNWAENVLAALEVSGDLQKLKDRWFKDSSWLERLP